MSEREDNVYKAKLAEQAERYDGKCNYLCITIFTSSIFNRYLPSIRRYSIIDICDSSIKIPKFQVLQMFYSNI